MAIQPITQFPADEAACVFAALQGGCKEDKKCQLHCSSIFFSYAQYQAQTVAMPAGLRADRPLTRAECAAHIQRAIDAAKTDGMHAISLPWLQIAEAVLSFLSTLFAGLFPVTPPTPAPTKGTAAVSSIRTLQRCMESADTGTPSILDTVLDFCGAAAAEKVEKSIASALGRGVAWTAIASTALSYVLAILKSGSIDVDGMTAAIDAL